MTRASVIVLLLIVLALAGVIGYGGYHYVSDHPSILSFLHSGSSPSTEYTTLSSVTQLPVVSFTAVRSIQSITFATEVNSTTQGGSTVYFSAGTSIANTTSIFSSSITSSVTSLSSAATSTQATSNQSTGLTSSQNWAFVLTYPPSISVAGGVAYLNVSYTNTLTSSRSVYLTATLSSASGTGPIGSPLLTIEGGHEMSLDLNLGQLNAGQYSVSFYVVDNSSGTQISPTTTVPFSV